MRLFFSALVVIAIGWVTFTIFGPPPMCGKFVNGECVKWVYQDD